MEPRIRYTTTSDGISIAYWALGEGDPLVFMGDAPWSHIQMEWQIPECRRWYEKLADGRTLIRFDQRGGGLSERNPAEVSLDGFQRDLEAVVDRLELERFDLFGFIDSGPVAITYAARNPERVSHLILWCTYATAGEYTDVPVIRGAHSLLAQDWQLYTETLAHIAMGWSLGESARRAAELMRESFTPEAMERTYGATGRYDTSTLLGQISSPTLVIHRRGVRWLPEETSRRLASRIPDARLVILNGDSVAPFLSDWQAALDAIEDFLGPAPSAPAPSPTGGFRTVLFTDIEGSTALTQRLGDAAARDVLREHERITREALRTHDGSEVKTMGDGFMASFGSATGALECAIAIQRAFEERNRGQAAEADRGGPLLIRVGLNAGEPIAEEQDLFGTAVITAARIAGQASGGEILASDVVRRLVAGKGFLFADRGETVLRGFEDPVRVYEVRWKETGS